MSLENSIVVVKLLKSNIINIDTTDSSRRERRPPYTFKSGAIYEGEWKGSIRDGWGIQTWSDGAKYEGK
jgi:hypothetical protein